MDSRMAKNHPQEAIAADVPADVPTGTMKRFTDGLKRVMAAQKSSKRKAPPKPK
jgi:hypothetical protein